MKKELKNLSLELRQGDISRQPDCVAIVNAANAQLRNGGGVAGAIHAAAGPDLEKEGIKLAPIATGEAVLTKTYKLPNQYVIHCLGPVYGEDKPEDVLLAKCYRNALEIAEKNQLSSIAFPAISTGIFGYPKRQAAEVALETVLESSKRLKHVKKLVFVLHTSEDLDIHQQVLEKLLSKNDVSE